VRLGARLQESIQRKSELRGAECVNGYGGFGKTFQVKAVVLCSQSESLSFLCAFYQSNDSIIVTYKINYPK
jgi:hypothetical protein